MGQYPSGAEMLWNAEWEWEWLERFCPLPSFHTVLFLVFAFSQAALFLRSRSVPFFFLHFYLFIIFLFTFFSSSLVVVPSAL